MSQSVKNTVKTIGTPSNRLKAGATKPRYCGDGINIAAEGIILIRLKTLQVFTGQASRATQGGYDSEILGSISAQFSTKVWPGRKVNRCFDVIIGSDSIYLPINAALAVLQRKGGDARTMQLGIDIDGVIRMKSQLICTPFNLIIYIHITRTALNEYITSSGRTEGSSKCSTGHITAGGSNGKIYRVNQPCTAFTQRSRSSYFGPIGNLNVGCTGFHKATVAAIWSTGIKCTPDVNGA